MCIFYSYETGYPLFDVKFSVPGAHNVSNALAAIDLSTTLGLDTESILQPVDKFGGADRRFQYKGKVNGVTIIDDYAAPSNRDPRNTDSRTKIST